MNWANWQAFFDMGGYALYVWGAYVVTAVLIVLELVLLALRRRAILRHLGAHEAQPGAAP